jgi:hypothetical protein
MTAQRSSQPNQFFSPLPVERAAAAGNNGMAFFAGIHRVFNFVNTREKGSIFAEYAA